MVKFLTVAVFMLAGASVAQDRPLQTFYVRGEQVDSCTKAGITVTASVAYTGKYSRAMVQIANQGKAAFDVFPESIMTCPPETSPLEM